MQFQYLPMSQVQEGSVVQRTKDTAGDFPVGLIKIVEKVSANTITIKGMGNYDKSRFKLIKTKPGSEAQPGDTIIKVSNRSDTPSPIGTIGTCVKLRDEYIHHNPKYLERNDFTSDWVVICTETDHLNIDYWQDKFEAGEDVWVQRGDSDIQKCRALGPEKWRSPVKFYDHDPRKADIETTVGTSSIYSEAGLSTNTTQQRESIMAKTTLEQLIELMTAPEPKDATNSKYVGILTKDDAYEGYLYFDKKSEAKEIMARPSNEGKQLHIFEYNKTLAQKPRDVIEVER